MRSRLRLNTKRTQQEYINEDRIHLLDQFSFKLDEPVFLGYIVNEVCQAFIVVFVFPGGIAGKGF